MVISFKRSEIEFLYSFLYPRRNMLPKGLLLVFKEALEKYEESDRRKQLYFGF